MKLNNDCIRDILLYAEDIDYNSYLTLDDLMDALPSYTENELQYHCIKLHEAGFLDITSVRTLSAPEQVVRITDLTYNGHQFLADIRSDNAWNKTKEIAKSVGSNSVNALKEIATSVISSLIQNQLGLH